MSAITQPNVRVTKTGWTLLSSATIQTLQLLSGEAGVIYAVAEPADTIKVGQMGHVLEIGDFLNNTEGGNSWGRAKDMSGSARFGITEG